MNGNLIVKICQNVVRKCSESSMKNVCEKKVVSSGPKVSVNG